MIIGITGLKTSGKDTSADYLLKTIPNSHKLSFADPLKSACRELFGFNNAQLYGDKKETPDEFWFGLTPRKVMQFFGTELVRNHMGELHEQIGNNFWIKCMEKQMSNVVESETNAVIIIPDVRFENEFQMIKRHGGIIIRINRPGLDQTDMHESEKYCMQFEADREVINDGSIEDLHEKLNSITV